MDAAAGEMRAGIRAAVADVPDDVLPKASKAALTELIGEMPNPAGDLQVTLRSEAGIGPGRVEGVMVAVEWTHADALCRSSIMLATRLDNVGEAAVPHETSTVFAALIG